MSDKNTIPKGWERKKIKDLLVFERPDRYIVKSTHYTAIGKTPVLTANKSFIKGYTDEDFGICNNFPVIIFDDFTTDSKYVDFPFKVKSSAIKILKPKDDKVNLGFVYEKMKSVDFPRGNHKRYYISQYQKLEVLTPPFPEQQKIADILSSADTEIEAVDKEIAATERLKRGLMQDLLTRGIGHKKFKKTELGEIPEEWEVRRIENLLNYERPDKYIVKSTHYTADGKTPVLTANKSFILGYTEEDFGIYQNFPVIIFDDFTTDSKYVDFSFKVKSSAIKILKPKNDHVNLKFVYEKMKSIDFPRGNHKRYYISQYQKLKVATPSFSEQKKIAEILSSVDNKLLISKQLKQKLLRLKKGLMRDLLSGRVRVR